MDDRNFDEQTAQDWIKAVELSERSFRDDFIYPKLNRLVTEGTANSILDIGCGQGICSDGIDLAGSTYTGIEPSPFLIERARHRYGGPKKAFLTGNAYSLPLGECSFDLAFSVMVWHLLSDLDLAASEMSRVLSKNGCFLVVTANPDAYSAWKGFYPDAEIKGKKLEGTMEMGEMVSRDTLYLHSLEDIKTAFSNAGLQIDATETFLKVGDQPNLLISIQGRKIT